MAKTAEELLKERIERMKKAQEEAKKLAEKTAGEQKK